MTWTSGIRKAGLAAANDRQRSRRFAHIPNTLTFIGLLINVVDRLLLRLRPRENKDGMFLYAGLVIIAAGLFDMVDGRVAARPTRSPSSGAFFDSVLDR